MIKQSPTYLADLKNTKKIINKDAIGIYNVKWVIVQLFYFFNIL